MDTTASNVPSVGDAPRTPRRSGQKVVCGWCRTEVPVPPRGRVPKWCSSSCRHRAWEQRRAADAGLAAVEVVDRVVEVVRVEKVVEERSVQVPVPRSPRSTRDWVDVLNRLDWALQTNRMELDDLREAATRLSPLAHLATVLPSGAPHSVPVWTGMEGDREGMEAVWEKHAEVDFRELKWNDVYHHVAAGL